ncbi:hypothetical protein FJZ17_04195, partial [Candidatus Pacearchaeota archaeon]|nr:hypothetical protein [Candidatus Pacearchaeota archaeon]
KCGCANDTDAQCDKWMLQMFNVTNIENPSNVSSSFCLGNGDCASGNCTDNVCVGQPIINQDVIYVDSCRYLSENGKNYVLTKDIYLPSNKGNCLVINASNIILDGNNYSLYGRGSGGSLAYSSGISTRGNMQGNVIKNFNNIANFSFGVYLFYLQTNTQIISCGFFNNYGAGIISDFSFNNVISNCSFISNTAGVLISDSNSTTISNSYFYNNSKGILAYNPKSSNLIFINNIFINNPEGVVFNSISNAIIDYNYFYNSTRAIIFSDSNSTTFSNSVIRNCVIPEGQIIDCPGTSSIYYSGNSCSIFINNVSSIPAYTQVSNCPLIGQG